MEGLYKGDCLDWLRSLPDGCADAIVTDPPYGIHAYEPPTWSAQNRGTCTDVTKTEWDRFGTEWVREASRVLCANGQLIAFCRMEDAGELRRAVCDAGIPPRGLMVWIKTTPIPRGARPVYQSAVEAMVWHARARAYVNLPPDGEGRWNVYQGPMVRSNTERNGHPTQKPEWLIERLIERHSPPGSLVLDPFLGSGTTAVACIKLGRRWAGAEITPEYWPIIEARVAEAERNLQPSLPLDGAAS